MTTYRDFIVGIDLGQARDYTAVAFVEMIEDEIGRPHDKDYDVERRFEVPQITRFPLGVSYVEVVNEIAKAVKHLPGADRVTLVVDATGCGRPVVDYMRQHDLVQKYGADLRPVTIVGGQTVTADADGWHVPKRVLVSNMKVLIETGAVKFRAGMEEAAAVKKEMAAFKVKISAAGNDSYEAWRESDHDDMVLATSIALWVGKERLCSNIPAHPLYRAAAFY